MQLAHGLAIALPGFVSSQAEQDDAQLVKAGQQGDQDAFALLVQRHQRRVFNMVLRKTHLFRARNLLKERLLAQKLCVPEPREQS
jgi:RNA polymerase sigma-70 factor (ECF subfamily)